MISMPFWQQILRSMSMSMQVTIPCHCQTRHRPLLSLWTKYDWRLVLMLLLLNYMGVIVLIWQTGIWMVIWTWHYWVTIRILTMFTLDSLNIMPITVYLNSVEDRIARAPWTGAIPSVRPISMVMASWMLWVCVAPIRFTRIGKCWCAFKAQMDTR